MQQGEEQKVKKTIPAKELRRALRQARADKLFENLVQQNEELGKGIMQNKFACACMQAEKFELAYKHLSLAKEILERLLPENIQTTNISMNLGNLFAQEKKFDIAIQSYKDVITKSPYANEDSQDQRSIIWSGRLNSYSAFVDAHTNIACLLANVEKLDDSYFYCKKAIEMNPFNFEAQINFGDLLRQLGRKQEAISHTWNQIVEYTKNQYENNYIQPEPIKCKFIPQTQIQSLTLNVLCVKWGTKYGADYVNKLYDGINRHSTLTKRFICLTEDSKDLNPAIEIIQLKGGWTGWWGKATLFALQKEQVEGRMFFIDLDMIITGNIDDILSYNGVFGILKTDQLACEKSNKDGYNSSIMAWNSNEYFQRVFSDLDKNTNCIKKFIVRFDFWLEMMIEEADFLQDLYPHQINDYVQECSEMLPQDTRIVCFPRSPKPHEAKADWIKEHWI